MSSEHATVRAALSTLPRWHVVHWGDSQSSTLLCLWVGGRETLVPVDGSTATYRGHRHSTRDGALADLLQAIQVEQDEHAMRSEAAQAARLRLLDAWHRNTAPSTREWTFSRGGFIRWSVNGEVHLEAGESSAAPRPVPPALLDVLVDLGWNPPNSRDRNCWLKPEDLESAADLAVLTPLAAFGYTEPPDLL